MGTYGLQMVSVSLNWIPTRVIYFPPFSAPAVDSHGLPGWPVRPTIYGCAMFFTSESEKFE